MIQIPVLHHRSFFGYYPDKRTFGSDFQRLETKIIRAEWKGAVIEDHYRAPVIDMFQIEVENKNPSYKNSSYLTDKKEVAQLLQRFECQTSTSLIGRPVNAYYIDKKLYAIEPVKGKN